MLSDTRHVLLVSNLFFFLGMLDYISCNPRKKPFLSTFEVQSVKKSWLTSLWSDFLPNQTHMPNQHSLLDLYHLSETSSKRCWILLTKLLALKLVKASPHFVLIVWCLCKPLFIDSLVNYILHIAHHLGGNM